MRRIICALAFIVGGSLMAQPGGPPICVSCQKPTTKRYHWADTPAFTDRQAVCSPCNNIETRCFECQLPTKVGFTKLKDGRILCPRHGKAALMSPREAQAIFRDAQRGVIQLLRDQGKLPVGNIEIQLIDQNQMRALLNGKPGDADKTYGVTETTRGPSGNFTHRISLLNGLTRPHTLAVAAHEYTHAWLAENVDRKLSASTVEGFCELVAYKVVTKLNLAVEQKTILANAYSEGQLDSLRKAADDYRFYEVVRWVKIGKSESLDEQDTQSVLALNQTKPALYSLPSSTRTRVPDTLTLKGISGTPKRRFALINDRTLEKNERGKVRVGDSSLDVRCVDITSSTVLLELVDTKEQIRLTLQKKPAAK